MVTRGTKDVREKWQIRLVAYFSAGWIINLRVSETCAETTNRGNYINWGNAISVMLARLRIKMPSKGERDKGVDTVARSTHQVSSFIVHVLLLYTFVSMRKMKRPATATYNFICT